MVQNLPDEWQTKAVRGEPRAKRPSEVVNADVVDEVVGEPVSVKRHPDQPAAR